MAERKPKLKPCPWCGVEPSAIRSDAWEIRGRRMWRVDCINDECGVRASTGWMKTLRAAQIVWNRRKP